ncbi:MAG: hypothetical protein JSW46_08250 [Gemmatimonadota bacterium]|nr:MAG: hypothetical protein JSW46_08250 [Gemmatimonadota bacterium]
MVETGSDRPIEGLEALKAPRRSEAQRAATNARILASAELPLARRRQPTSSLDVLAAWGRRGLVAASIALAILAGSLQPWRAWQQEPSQPVVLEEVIGAAGEPEGVPALLVAYSEPDLDAVAAAALLERNGNRSVIPENVEQR